MSAEPDAMSAQPAAAQSAAKPTRPFYWSVRRELWENSAVYLAPLVVAGLGLFGYLISLRHLPRDLRAAVATQSAHLAAPLDPGLAKLAAHAHAIIGQPYDFLSGSVFVTSMVVAIFYSVGSLYAERRDRSVLFWKSLPVSDRTTVLSKAMLPLVLTPLVMFAVAIGAHLVMLAASSLVLMASGISPSELFAQLSFPFEWLGLARGLFVMTLWYAPIVGWLMLVSGWARRVAILWALGPWAALCIFEILAFHTTYIWGFVRHRLAGGMEWAFTDGGKGGAQIHTLAQLDLVPVLTSPEVLVGVVVAAALIAGCVWQRRYRDPI
jgi:ABC-2 type transport system permease protein